MTRPVYRPRWAHVMVGASFWLLISIVGWSFYKVLIP